MALLPQLFQTEMPFSVFTSLFWQELFKLMGTELCLSTAYHPQSDGQTEIVNKCLENYLRCMCGDCPKQWVNWLSLAEWWYNSSYHSSIKTTPFYAVYGHNPPDHNFTNLGSSTVAAVENWAKERPSILRMLKENLQQAQHRMKFYVDKLRSEREFEEGDWEYLRLQPYFLSPAEEYEVVSKILWAFSSALKGRKGCL